MPEQRLARSYCEICGRTWQPRSKREDGVACTECMNDYSGALRQILHRDPLLREEAVAMTTGLVRRVIPHRMTNDEYHAMNVKQGGRCAICGTQPDTGNLVIDHNHRTGEVRALLCNDCNKGIGCMGDHPEILLKAAEYLYLHGHYGCFPRAPEVVRTRKPGRRKAS